MSDPGVENQEERDPEGDGEDGGASIYAAPIGPTRPGESPLFIENPYDEVEEEN